MAIDFKKFSFQPVIRLPEKYEVYDFTENYNSQRVPLLPYGIGRYNEDRKGMYTASLFQGVQEARTIHMGIDIGAPAGTPIYAFLEGEIFLFGINPQEGDYGPTLITKHRLGADFLFALHGHLATESLSKKEIGQKFAAGEELGWVGKKSENGGWNPHLHFQLSLEEPKCCDMPGVVSASQRAQALCIYPNPLLVLGPLYPE